VVSAAAAFSAAAEGDVVSPLQILPAQVSAMALALVAQPGWVPLEPE